MSEAVKDIAIAALRHDEGLRLNPYTDSAGKLTIGYGRNLTDVGISQDEAEAMLETDVDEVVDACREFPWFQPLNAVRQAVIVNMAFNLGIGRLTSFRKMIAALEAQDFIGAALEMGRSRWAGQVGRRATRLAQQMRDGYTR